MFYIDTTTKKFAAGPQLSNSSGQCCYCCQGTQVPLFLRTKVANPSLIKKPVLTHYETAVLQFSLKDSQGFPYDLTDKELILAVDNTFQHSDSLICISSDVLILDAAQGLVQFTVKCSSVKFNKLVSNKIPASQVYMEITAYSPQDIQGTVLLQDRGITLQPKLYTTQGIPQDNDPNYYNKQQTRSVIAAYIKTAQAQSNSQLQQQLMDFIHQKFYDKGEVDSIVSALSDSITLQLQGLHIQKDQVPAQGFAATYRLLDLQGNTRGVPINVLQDSSLKDMHYIEASQEDLILDPSLIIGDPYLKLQFYTKGQQQSTAVSYVPLKNLVDVYTAGPGLQGTSQFSIKLSSDSQTVKYLQVTSNGLAVKNLDGSFATVQDINEALAGYYTKTQVQQLVSQLSTSIDLSAYYTKGQVDQLLQEFSDSVDLSNYYTKYEVDYALSSLSDSFNNKLLNYYTKVEVDAITGQLSSSIIEISNKFQDYYTKIQVDDFISGLDQLVGSPSDSPSYVKREIYVIEKSLPGTVGQFLQLRDNGLRWADVPLADYYTKVQTNALLAELSDSFNAVLSNKLDAPVGGTAGQFLQKGSDSNHWADIVTDLQKVTLSSSSFKPQDNTFYVYEPVDGDTVQFLTGNPCKFYMEVDMPSDSVTFTFPASLQWQGDPPAFTAGSTVDIQVLYNGEVYKASTYPDLSNYVPISGNISTIPNITMPGNTSLITNDAQASYTVFGGGRNTRIAGNHIDIRATASVRCNGYEQNKAGGFCINDSNGNLKVPGSITSAGQQIIALTSASFEPKDNKVYTKTLQQSDSIVIDTTGLTASKQVTFELHLIQPSTAVTFTLPNTIIWADGDSFASANSAPDISTADTLYCLVFRWDGSDLLGNLAYTKAIEVSA